METFYQTLQSIGYTHPVHPTMVYLPIGGVMAAFIFGWTALLFNHSHFAVSAKHCIILALIAVFPTILFGYMDWRYYHGGNWIFPIKMKIILAAFLVFLLSLALLFHGKLEADSKAFLPIYTLCFLTVVAIGYCGGEIVFGGREVRETSQVQGREGQAGRSKEKITFADVSKIFDQHCNMCHKGSSASFDLRLDTYDDVMEGGKNGPVVVPGKPNESELVLRINGKSKPVMPFMQPALPEGKIQTIVHWIEQGALRAHPKTP